ncbi:MAG: VOC family protein [Syntrophomonadaceae bacterium]|jgi:lactoylglutathione lyase|nr:VOC family protein [Syntrophomonadaceae bacterium]
MYLGAHSLSLTVKDIEASKTFYEKLGFQVFMGDIEEKWLIMKNGDCVIGLFQGMFERNMLTFNPGWNINAEEVNPFDDIRVIQETLRKNGIEIIHEVDPESKGPASFMVIDPDGNPILFDQHR